MTDSDATAPSSAGDQPSDGDKKLFWACFVALVATSFVFGVRATLIGQLGDVFNLSQSEIGVILGAGMWPFAISIILFSLIIDKIGYKTAAFCAIVCHVVSIVWTLFAKDKTGLLFSTLLVAFGNGIVEAFINPVVATAYPKQKAKWLNILHAGWPLGLALGALFTVLLGYMKVDWQVQFAMCLIPVVIYAILVFPRKFPPNERVAAGISYRDMLREVGGVGFFIIGALLSMAVIQIYTAVSGAEIEPKQTAFYGAVAGIVIGMIAGLYTRSIGNMMFLLILITMGPLATTELGTDGWMQQLLEADLPKLAGWIFIGVSIIMTILRFYAGPIVHRFSPIGLLVLSAIVAIIGLLFLWKAAGLVLIAAAVVYAFGKTFLWSTTLGLVSEQFPKGGALTLNGVSAVGVLGLGILGSPLMGIFLDGGIDKDLKRENPELHARVNGEPRSTIFGMAPSLDPKKVDALEGEKNATVEKIVNRNKKAAFMRQAVLPAFMLLCYLILFFYFKSRGGYKPVDISAEPSSG